MIKVEQILTDLFNTIPVYEDNNKLFFHYGGQKELNAVLLTKQSNGSPAYPLLWYNLPNEVKSNDLYAEGIFTFVLAHNTFNTDQWFNDQRFANVYNAILFPHLQLVKQALKGANGIDLRFVDKSLLYDTENLPNYGNPVTFEGKDEQKQVDAWDAIKLKVNLRINKNACGFENIYYKTNNLE